MDLGKRLLLLVIKVFVFLLLSVKMAKGGEGMDRPNILLIVADDLGYEMLGSYGGTDVSTPQLDRMAEKGMRFTRAYASPVCTPSRMSCYTGEYAPRHEYTRVLPIHEGSRESVDFIERFTSYAQLLRDGGYQTSVTGKWQLAGLEFHPEHCRDAGFESWCVWQIWHDNQKTKRYWNPTLNRDGRIIPDVADQFGPDILTEYVIERMRQAKEAKEPFLIHHNMMLPHSPITETPENQRDSSVPSLKGMIRYMDQQIGILLKALDTLGFNENTIVIFVGDNGTESTKARRTSEGEVAGGKWDLNDAGIHVPLIAYGPGQITAGGTVSDLVEITDFFATLCELSGVKVPANAAPDSISFAGLITGKGVETKREWVTAAIGNDFIVFDGNWRMHYKDKVLVDCRNLPQEIPADMSEPEAKVAEARLLPIVDRLGAQYPIQSKFQEKADD